MNTGEGKIEIPLEEFWEFVDKYHDHKSCNLCFGKPFLDKDNHTIEINYAFGYESNPPQEWVDKPGCLKEWD